jgi:hypothetical protein
MIKTLLTYLILLFLPLLTLAQNEPPLMEDFIEGARDVNTFAMNDHVNILQINKDNENFDLMAVNDKMQVLWTNTFTGYALSVDKFKDKIVALVSTDHSFFKGSNDTYKAYLVDPANGKLIVEKVIYTGPNEYRCFAQLNTGKGAFMKLAVRQTGLKRSIKVALPGPLAFFSIRSYNRQGIQTTAMQILDFDEKLNVTSTITPIISNGTYISTDWNKQGDMFVSWLNGPSVEVYKYDAGKTSPSAQMTASVTFKEDKDNDPSDNVIFKPSDDGKTLYYTMLYKNLDKDLEFGIGKLDFSTNKKDYTAQLLTKKYLKSIKKSFVPVNKDIDDVDMGSPGGMSIRYMDEIDGKIVTALSSRTMQSSSINSYGVWRIEDATLLIGYDTDFKQKFQTVLPSGYAVPERNLATGYHFVKNKLYVLANNKSGMRTIKGMYGVLDVNTGQWEKMTMLSKKHISNSDFMDGASILWFGSNYIVPYFKPKGLMQSKYNITLQQNQY